MSLVRTRSDLVQFNSKTCIEVNAYLSMEAKILSDTLYFEPLLACDSSVRG